MKIIKQLDILKNVFLPQHHIIVAQESQIIMRYIGVIWKNLGVGTILHTGQIFEKGGAYNGHFISGGCTVITMYSMTVNRTLNGW